MNTKYTNNKIPSCAVVDWSDKQTGSKYLRSAAFIKCFILYQ